jgi:hypothetical protein
MHKAHKQPKAMLEEDAEELEMPYRVVQLWTDPFDILDTTLEHSLEIVRFELPKLIFRREILASGKVKYLLFANNELVEEPSLLGSIELKKTDNEITQVTLERLVRHRHAVPFEKAVKSWKAYIQYDKDVAQAVREREKSGAGQEKPVRGRLGRPHEQDDIWAWTQIHVEHREPSTVYREWCGRPGVAARNLVDPRRQFRRIIDPWWRTKSGRKV